MDLLGNLSADDSAAIKVVVMATAAVYDESKVDLRALLVAARQLERMDGDHVAAIAIGLLVNACRLADDITPGFGERYLAGILRRLGKS